MSSAYARGVEPSERQPGKGPGTKRRTPVRVPGEHETAEVPQVGPVTQDYQLPDIVPAGPRTEVTPIVPPVDDGLATSDLPATEPMVRADPQANTGERVHSAGAVVTRRLCRGTVRWRAVVEGGGLDRHSWQHRTLVHSVRMGDLRVDGR